jgi:uroporphyrinogen-III synthase
MLELDTRSCESYSKDLANHIIDGYSSESFSYLCNENRMDELPSMLKTANVDCKEYITYQSNVIDFSDIDVYDNDIYMWFSPMGVKALANKILKEGVFHYAIGETTAKELMKENINSEQIFYPTIPSVDGMIELINNRHK